MTRPYYYLTRCAMALCVAGLISTPAFTQNVTGIVTDYNTYWKSTSTLVNSVKPDNSHNLLAFTYNGTTYSTGVNDAALVAHGETFVANDFWSLPVGSITGSVTSNTKIGLGEKYDGVTNGPSNPPPSNNMTTYLTDGIKGLNIGTCVANLPVGSLNFLVSSITSAAINDGIPDILVTQVADPSGTADRYQFTDANGNIVGNYVDISFNSVNPVGNWTVDFYEASTNPMTLTSGFTKTDRPLRLWAADLSSFGITAANYQSIKNFKITLAGNSDVAFVAYSNRSFAVRNVLPVTLGSFTGSNANGKGLLKWNTYSESNSAWFIIEKSNNNSSFTVIDSVKAAGTSYSAINYSATDNALKPGANYYRLKMLDADGQLKYSDVISITGEKKTDVFGIYPNPASTGNPVYVTHDKATGKETLTIYNAAGTLLAQQYEEKGSQQTTLTWQSSFKGMFFIILNNGVEKKVQKLIIE